MHFSGAPCAQGAPEKYVHAVRAHARDFKQVRARSATERIEALYHGLNCII